MAESEHKVKHVKIAMDRRRKIWENKISFSHFNRTIY